MTRSTEREETRPAGVERRGRSKKDGDVGTEDCGHLWRGEEAFHVHTGRAALPRLP